MKHLNAQGWKAFLSRHDLTWTSVGEEWEQGAFLGNGTLGAMIYKQNDHAIRWEIGSCEVVERFQIPRIDWAPPRLLLGDFTLNTIGKIESAEMRLDLWNAEATGSITTDCGTITWRSFVHTSHMVIFIEMEGTGEEKDASFNFIPEHGISPCLHYPRLRANADPEWLKKHTPEKPTQEKADGINFSTQDYLAGGQYSVAWKETTTDDKQCLFASIASTYPQRNAISETKSKLKPVLEMNLDEWVRDHRKWWHDFYPKSFISMSDPYWESVYWIQIYKLGSATRSDSPIIDSQGPWLTKTPWPTCVWNLNVQTSYSPLFTSNRFEIAESLFSALDKNLPSLIMNVPDPFRVDSAGIGRSSSCITLESKTFPGFETGNLAWVCFTYYRHYRASMDEKMLRERLYPIMKRAINYYFHLTEEGADGKIHLLYSVSPEYGPDKYTKDCSYDLALFEWGCRTLLDITERLDIDDERKKDWQDVVDRLVDTHTDERGIRVGKDLSFAQSHRHFSHLFSIWPLRIRNIEHPEEQSLIDQSIKNWLSLDEELQGYTWTSSSCMASSFGDGDTALDRLNELRPYLQPNTMYVENGPVIETPISAAESIHDMLLQSWTDPQAKEHMSSVIRIFPAVPTSWKDISFSHLRAEGAFQISANRKNGKTEWIHIESLAGEPCIIQTDIEGSLESNEATDLIDLGNGRWKIPMKKGDSIILYKKGTTPNVMIKPIEFEEHHHNIFGMESEQISIQNGKPAH